MNDTGKAYFVPDPSVLEDIFVPHLVTEEKPYEIVKTITLSAMDYGNFVTDLQADRQFIEDNAALCGRDGVWRCLLVRRRGNQDGVLVMPEDGAFVGWAAYFCGNWAQKTK